jgi:hypothetical protein
MSPPPGFRPTVIASLQAQVSHRGQYPLEFPSRIRMRAADGDDESAQSRGGGGVGGQRQP